MHPPSEKEDVMTGSASTPELGGAALGMPGTPRSLRGTS